MCGFIGFTSPRPMEDAKKTIQRMSEAIRHRGPDSDGIYSDEKLTLGFRRLMIIDLSEEASQPLYNEDQSIVLVFNGEIYNYLELREELIGKGHIFQTQSDSEVLIHGYEEYGTELLHRLRGMFAFAIWDKKQESLFIARDIFGIKPLYYTQHTEDGSLLFGSEIKAFMKHPAFIKELNKAALKPYLTFQYSVMDETFFKGVYKLRPGHYMLFQNGKLETKRYWSPSFKKQDGSFDQYVKAIQETMDESVRYHRISDVKVGSFLSGGIDSSYITSLLKPNKTFSVGFDEHEAMFNETHHAKDLSDLLGLENHKTIVSADECFEMLPTIQYHMDEPQSNVSSVPLYFLARLAREHVTVVLSGEGADELFAGYAWYQKSRKAALYEKLPRGVRRAISGLSAKLPRHRWTEFLIKGGQEAREKFIGHARVFTEQDAADVLKDEYVQGPTVQSITAPIYDEVQDQDELAQMQYLDLHLWLPGDILLKADKMSMAHSLELRVPFLDKEVIGLSSKIPSDYLVDHEHTKHALRVAAKESLPEEWAKRRRWAFLYRFVTGYARKNITTLSPICSNRSWPPNFSIRRSSSNIWMTISTEKQIMPAMYGPSMCSSYGTSDFLLMKIKYSRIILERKCKISIPEMYTFLSAKKADA